MLQIFQRIWSGRVIDERKAWELLCLIDQIHHYATTRFRDYVIQHLQTWHNFCDKNFLLNWVPSQDVPEDEKWRRNAATPPRWARHLNKKGWQDLQRRAGKSLQEERSEIGDYVRNQPRPRRVVVVDLEAPDIPGRESTRRQHHDST